MKQLLCIVILLVGGVGIALGQWDMEVLFDRSGRTDSATYGNRVIPLGDQDHDGFDDWAVEANYYGNPEMRVQGYVEIFLGGNPVPQEPYLAFQRPWSYMQNLVGLTNFGDINGDRFDDFCTGGGCTLIRMIEHGSGVLFSFLAVPTWTQSLISSAQQKYGFFL